MLTNLNFQIEDHLGSDVEGEEVEMMLLVGDRQEAWAVVQMMEVQKVWAGDGAGEGLLASLVAAEV